MVRCWTSRLDSWMPWLSLSNASVCLSVTCSPLSTVFNFALLPVFKWPDFQHVAIFVGYVLENAPRLVPDPRHGPTLFVRVLFLGRKVRHVADEILTHHLAVLVEDGLDDVPELVDRAPRGRTSSVGGLLTILDTLPGSLLRSRRALIPHAVCLFRDLSCGVAHTLDRLARRIPDALRRLASTLSGLPDTLASLLSRLPRSCPGFLGSLTRSLSGRLSSLAGALADILDRRFGTRTHVLYSFAGALHCLTGTRAHIFHGLTCTFDGFAGARTDVLHGLSGALYSFASAFAHVLYGRSGTGTNVFYRGTGSRTNVFDSRACSLAHIFDRRTG